MDTVILSKAEANRLLEVLRVAHRSMRELADVIPTAIHEDYDPRRLRSFHDLDGK